MKMAFKGTDHLHPAAPGPTGAGRPKWRAGLFLAAALVFALGGAVPLMARESSVEQLEQRKASDKEREERRKERQEKKGKAAAPTAPKTVIPLAFLMREVEAPPVLSNLDPFLTDEGVYGARLGIEDNETTGRFTGQGYTLEEVTVPLGGDLASAFKGLAAKGIHHIVVNLPAEDILQLADLPEAKDVLIYNASAPDDSLRNEQCRANVLHVIPNRAMLADALAQYLVKKKWKKWFLVTGPQPGDTLYAEAIRRAAKKFGAKIVTEKKWDQTFDLRESAQSEIPVFTQEAKSHDILVIADERGEFGEYFIYHTWEPTLVAGTQGLTPTAWHRTHESWGAAQMQNRFRRAASRWMTPIDYAAWTAVRSVGEASSRNPQADTSGLRAYILGPEFGVAAYKGIKLSYRSWDGQLRQPVLLASPRAMVSVSPQQGFLHPVSEADTLGYDKPESKCKVER